MPIYSSINTIEEVMRDKDIIKWRILSDVEEQMHHLEPPSSIKWTDSFNTLKSFLNELQGTTHVVVQLYTREYKPNAGGALANMIFKHYYKLQPFKQDGQQQDISGFQNGSFQQILGLHSQLAEMKLQMLTNEQSRKIEDLEKRLKDEQKQKPSEFESVAKIIGREFAREIKRKKGGAISDDVEDGISEEPKKPEQAKEEKETESNGKRAGKAIADISKVAGQTETIEALEKIASLAKNNPVKLAEILQPLADV